MPKSEKERSTEAVVNLLARWSKASVKQRRLVQRDVPWLAVALDRAYDRLVDAIKAEKAKEEA